jgi:diguanylate cyclase (GGDEF)-like protein/PAS domain S-box-containing protein
MVRADAAAVNSCVTSAGAPPLDAAVVSLPQRVLATAVRMLTARQKYIVAVVGSTDSLGEAAARLGISRKLLVESLRPISARLGLSDPTKLARLARRQVLLAASPQGIFGVGPDGRCLFANRVSAEMFGYTPDELLGANIHELIHHSRADGSRLPPEACTILAALHRGDIDDAAEEVFWHRDSRPIWVAYAVASVGLPGSPRAAVVVLEDISDRVRSAQALSISHASLEMVLDAAQTVAFQVDLRTGRTVCSDNAFRALGLDAGTTVMTYEDFLSRVHPEDRTRVELNAMAALPVDQLVTDDIRLIPTPGEERLYRRRVRVVPDALGQPATLLGVAVDITALHEKEEEYSALVQMSTDAFIGMDVEGRVTNWNPAAERIFGLAQGDALGQPMANLIIPPRYREAHGAAIRRILAEPTTSPRALGPMELWAVRSDGMEFPVEVTVATVPITGGFAFRAFVRDISARKEMEAQLVHEATTDRLTGLPNRAVLSDRLAAMLENLGQTGSPLAVLLVDMDHFKVVNDGLGHGVGDQFLRLMAQRLEATVRPRDTVARFGGDEFVVICEGADESEASAIAQRILEALERPATVAGYELVGGVSIGIVVTSDPGRDPESLLRDADAAMYRAKERGRGRAEMFDGPLRRQAMARLELACALRHALDRGELSAAYQPVVSIDDNHLVGAEALARWHHPTLGAVPPADFIPIAEETGVIVSLGAWILRTACRDLARWAAERAATFSLWVNLSCRQLLQPDLADVVGSVLDETGLHPSTLCLEITETVLMEDSKLVAEAIERLHGLGVTLAVDDFGTGYSSLLYLRRFPVQILKLDRTFVAGLGRNETDTTIVRSTIELAHSLGIQALAEGIERSEQLELLRAMGCDLGQGYFWGLPSRDWRPSGRDPSAENGEPAPAWV